jgi:hypothetical protein
VLDLGEKLIPVPGVGYDRQILFATQHDDDRLPEKGVAIGHENADGAVRCLHV